MEEVTKPYGVVTDDCVELVGKDAVPITGKKGLRDQTGPTTHYESTERSHSNFLAESRAVQCWL